MTMKAEIKVIEYGNNTREDIRAGGKTVQLTLDTGERVYRWEHFYHPEDPTGLITGRNVITSL